MTEADGGSGRSPSGTERAVVAIVAATLPAYLALEGGGYDLVVRQGLGLVVWWFLALAFAFGLLPRARPAGGVRVAALALAGLVAWTAIGLLGTESEARTFEELARILTYAGLLVLAWAALGPGTWRAAAAGLSVAALVVPLIAVASRLEPGAFAAIAPAAVLEPDRLTYPLGYWNAVAAWSAMAFCLGLAWSAHSARAETRVLALAALPVAGLALYLTYSRAGIAALLIGIAVVVVAAANRVTATVHALFAVGVTGLAALVVRSQPEIADGAGSEGGPLVALALVVAAGACGLAALLTWRARMDRLRISVPRRLTIAASGGAAVVVAVAMVIGSSVAVRAGDELPDGARPALPDDPVERLVSLEGPRGEIWGSALRAFRSSPVSGIGAGSFQFWWQRDVAQGESLRDAHSLYLETLAELGALGLLALLALLGAILLGALRAQRAVGPSGAAAASGLLAAYVVFLFHAGIDWLWEFPSLIVLGVGAGLVAGAARASPAPARSRLGWRRLALVALAIVAGAAQIPSLVSTNRARAAEEALVLGLRERATEFAGEAVRAAPWAAQPYALRAFIALSDDRPHAARPDARAAIVREPTNWRHRALLAYVEAEVGNAKAALAALDEAEGLRPGLADEFERARRAVRSGETLLR